jgi:hypothetical protein
MTALEPNLPRTAVIYYEILVRGSLHSRWFDWFDGLSVANQADGLVRLFGPLRDQAELHGALNKIRDLNLELVSLRMIEKSLTANDTNVSE